MADKKEDVVYWWTNVRDMYRTHKVGTSSVSWVGSPRISPTWSY